MGKILSIAVVLGLSLNAMAADPYLANFKAGKWEGKVTNSVLDTLKGKAVTATTTASGEAVTVTMKVAGAQGQEREEWKITPTQLLQTEFDAAGKAVATYAADLRKGGTETSRTFDVHCTDRAAKKCDQNIDPKFNWTLTADSKAGTFIYIVNGPQDKNNPESAVIERHRFELKNVGQ